MPYEFELSTFCKAAVSLYDKFQDFDLPIQNYHYVDSFSQINAKRTLVSQTVMYGEKVPSGNHFPAYLYQTSINERNTWRIICPPLTK